MATFIKPRGPLPTTAQLGFESRRRIARQIAETSGIAVVAFGDAIGIGEAVKL